MCLRLVGGIGNGCIGVVFIGRVVYEWGDYYNGFVDYRLPPLSYWYTFLDMNTPFTKMHLWLQMSGRDKQ